MDDGAEKSIDGDGDDAEKKTKKKKKLTPSPKKKTRPKKKTPGRIAQSLGLPSVTGYAAAGAALGPDCAALLSRRDLSRLAFLDAVRC